MVEKVCLNCEKKYSTTQVTRSKFCCRSCANSFNTRMRFTEDNSIFSEGIIDQFTAYVYGFICADGCVSYDKHSKRNRLTITSNDLEIMSAFHNKMTPNKKIYTQGKNYKVVSNSEKDIKFLINSGVTERKSKTLSMPCNVPKDLLPHFVRGYFDGDGCVYISKTTTIVNKEKVKIPYVYVSFTSGSYNMANDIKEILYDNGIISKVSIDKRNKKEKSNVYYIKITRKKSVEKFCEWIYTDSVIHLTRKRDKFTKCDIV